MHVVTSMYLMAFCESVSVNRRVIIPRITLTTADSALLFILKGRQLLMRLVYSMTINKSYGEAFKQVGLLLMKPVFAHGQ